MEPVNWAKHYAICTKANLQTLEGKDAERVFENLNSANVDGMPSYEALLLLLQKVIES